MADPELGADLSTGDGHPLVGEFLSCHVADVTDIFSFGPVAFVIGEKGV